MSESTAGQKQVSIAFQSNKVLSEYGPLAAQAEAYGFDGVTVYNDMLYQPAWLPLLKMAHATQRVRIGVAAVNPFTCHPINIAANIALLDEASGGRAYLGIARGAWLDFVGLHPKRIPQQLGEAVRAIRHLLRRDPVPLAGEFFPLAGGDALRWEAIRPDIPILLGTWGEQTLRACMGNFQEIKVGGSANPDLIPHFRTLLTNLGDVRQEIRIAIGAVSVVDEDAATARALARREVALYLPVVAALDPTLSLDPALIERLQTAADRNDYDAAAADISDELLRRFAFAGSPTDLVDQTLALYAAGAQRVEYGTPHGVTPQQGLRLFGERVLPALQKSAER